MMVCLKTERNGDKALINGLMKASILEIGSITILKERENTGGPTVEFTKVNGKKINFMEEVSTPGQMVECITETMKMIRNMDKEPTLGQMENPMRDSGLTVNSMEKLGSPIQKEEARWVSGKMEKESNG